MIKDSYLNKVKYMLKQSGYRNSCIPPKLFKYRKKCGEPCCAGLFWVYRLLYMLSLLVKLWYSFDAVVRSYLDSW